MRNQSREYVRSLGQKCPECRSSEINASGEFLTDMDIVWREVNCQKCDTEWTEVFQLTGAENIQRGNG